MSKFASFISGAIFGAAAGFVAGILIAPQEGKKTRDDLSDILDNVNNDFAQNFKNARESVYQSVKEMSKSITGDEQNGNVTKDN